jgi:hypothetical protein
MKSVIRAWMLVSLLLPMPAVASAQDVTAGQDPSQNARFQWGAIRFTPSINFNNVGVDTNVFNAPGDPRQDTTAAVGPAVSLWTHVKRARVTGKTAGQYLYFKTYDNQRGWDTTNELQVDLPMARLKPFVAGSYVNTHDRPGYEIDSRSRATTNGITFGTDLRVSGKTSFVFSGSWAGVAFDRSETFLGSELAHSLNRRSDTQELQFLYALTPLTTLVVKNDAIQDRFDSEKTRDANSVRVMPGFQFKPFALISGSAFVGFRHFNALNDALPDFNGIVAMVDANYVVSSTRIHTRLDRDLNFSYDDSRPYYALTDLSLTLTERITHTWDVTARSGWQTLDYRQLQDVRISGRTDSGRSYGGGVGHRFGEVLRIGIDVNYLVRRSQDLTRDYDGLRAGLSISYGTAQ